jgi:hypothetical protein
VSPSCLLYNVGSTVLIQYLQLFITEVLNFFRRYDFYIHINSDHRGTYLNKNKKFCTSVSAVHRRSGMQQCSRSLKIHCDVYWQTCLQGIMLLLSVHRKTVSLSTRQLISLWRHIAKWRHHVCQFTDLGCKRDRQMRVLFRKIVKQTVASLETNSIIICQPMATALQRIKE